MSYRTRLLLFNNFVQTLDENTQLAIENFVGTNYSMDNAKILSYFGLENQFNDYVGEYDVA